MARRVFSWEFKVEAVRLVRERGVSVAQASRDIDVHETVLRKWVKDFGADPKQAFPGHGVPTSPQLTVSGATLKWSSLNAWRRVNATSISAFGR